MGLDLLDITFRLEKRFVIKIPRVFWDELFTLEQPDVQIGTIHQAVCRILVEAGRPIPPSSWHRVQICIAEAVGVPPAEIHPESWLRKDLDASL